MEIVQDGPTCADNKLRDVSHDFYEEETGMPLITKEFLEAGQVSRGSWDKKQFSLLGLSWPPKKEWQKSVIGTKIPKDVAEQFLAMGGQDKKSRHRARPADLSSLLAEPPVEQDAEASDTLPVIGFDTDKLAKVTA